MLNRSGLLVYFHTNYTHIHISSFAALHGLHASRYALASPYSCYTPGFTTPGLPPPSLPVHPAPPSAAAAPPAAGPSEVKRPSLVTSQAGPGSTDSSMQVISFFCSSDHIKQFPDIPVAIFPTFRSDFFPI